MNETKLNTAKDNLRKQNEDIMEIKTWERNNRKDKEEVIELV